MKSNKLIQNSFYIILFAYSIITSQASEYLEPKDILSNHTIKNWSQFSKQQVSNVITIKPIDYHKLGLIFLSNDEHTLSNNYFVKSNLIIDIYYRAYSQYKLNNLENSLKLIQEYIAKSSLNESGINLYINILYDMGNYIELKEAIRLSKQNNISNQNITYKIGLLNLNDNNCAQAIENFESLLLINPNATKIKVPLSKAYRMCGNQFKANDLIKQDNNGLLVSNDPLLVSMYEFGNPTHLIKPKIKALLEIRDYDNALKSIKKLLTIQPFDAEVWINYGSILVFQGQDYHEAELAYTKAFELDPKNQMNLRNLINLTKKTNPKESINWANILFELNPIQIDALTVLGDYHFNNNEFALAIDLYNRLYEQSADNKEVLMKIVKILVIQKDYLNAINKCEMAFNENNTSTDIASMLARVLLISSIYSDTDGTHINEVNIQRALRISKNIVRIDNNFKNKFTLLMSLTLSKHVKEANQLRQELTYFSFDNAHKITAQQLNLLSDYNQTIESLDFNWIW